MGSAFNRQSVVNFSHYRCENWFYFDFSGLSLRITNKFKNIEMITSRLFDKNYFALRMVYILTYQWLEKFHKIFQLWAQAVVMLLRFFYYAFLRSVFKGYFAYFIVCTYMLYVFNSLWTIYKLINQGLEKFRKYLTLNWSRSHILTYFELTNFSIILRELILVWAVDVCSLFTWSEVSTNHFIVAV